MFSDFDEFSRIFKNYEVLFLVHSFYFSKFRIFSDFCGMKADFELYFGEIRKFGRSKISKKFIQVFFLIFAIFLKNLDFSDFSGKKVLNHPNFDSGRSTQSGINRGSTDGHFMMAIFKVTIIWILFTSQKLNE